MMGPRALLPLLVLILAAVVAVSTVPAATVALVAGSALGGALATVGALCWLLPGPVRKAALWTARTRAADLWR